MRATAPDRVALAGGHPFSRAFYAMRLSDTARASGHFAHPKASAACQVAHAGARVGRRPLRLELRSCATSGWLTGPRERRPPPASTIRPTPVSRLP
ncbi:hypothetical protein MRX96_007101 [Rhipicephalus microplus]